MDFSQMAQDFVEATSLLVGGRTINIMDTRGIIIASTEKKRVGTFHQGAIEVIATGKAVLIHKLDLDKYPGAKEGYNMPIWDEGNLIGVVGIFGEPEEVSSIANLLRVYVTQYFRYQALAKRRQLEKSIYTQILKLLLYADEEQASSIQQLCNIIGVKFSFPVCVCIFTPINKSEPMEYMDCFAQLEQNLIWKSFINKKTDIYDVQDNQFVLIHSLKSQESKKEYIMNFHDASGINSDYRLSVSDICTDIKRISSVYYETCVLSHIDTESISDMSDYKCRQQYLLHLMQENEARLFIDEMIRCLIDNVDRDNMKVLLKSAGVYYDENSSIAKASERLHIHKNTLLYRMNRIFMLLGLKDQSAFTREFFIRLLIDRWKIKLPK